MASKNENKVYSSGDFSAFRARTTKSSIIHNGRRISGTIIPNRIFVGGISTSSTESDLRHYFEKYGPIESCRIIMDPTGCPKGYGFVTFENEESVRRLQPDAENLYLNDRQLNIAPAIQKWSPHYYYESSPATSASSILSIIPPVVASSVAPTSSSAAPVYVQNGSIQYTYHNGMAYFQPSQAAYNTASSFSNHSPHFYPVYASPPQSAQPLQQPSTSVSYTQDAASFYPVVYQQQAGSSNYSVSAYSQPILCQLPNGTVALLVPGSPNYSYQQAMPQSYCPTSAANFISKSAPYMDSSVTAVPIEPDMQQPDFSTPPPALPSQQQSVQMLDNQQSPNLYSELPGHHTVPASTSPALYNAPYCSAAFQEGYTPYIPHNQFTMSSQPASLQYYNPSSDTSENTARSTSDDGHYDCQNNAGGASSYSSQDYSVSKGSPVINNEDCMVGKLPDSSGTLQASSVLPDSYTQSQSTTIITHEKVDNVIGSRYADSTSTAAVVASYDYAGTILKNAPPQNLFPSMEGAEPVYYGATVASSAAQVSTVPYMYLPRGSSGHQYVNDRLPLRNDTRNKRPVYGRPVTPPIPEFPFHSPFSSSSRGPGSSRHCPRNEGRSRINAGGSQHSGNKVRSGNGNADGMAENTKEHHSRFAARNGRSQDRSDNGFKGNSGGRVYNNNGNCSYRVSHQEAAGTVLQQRVLIDTASGQIVPPSYHILQPRRQSHHYIVDGPQQAVPYVLPPPQSQTAYYFNPQRPQNHYYQNQNPQYRGNSYKKYADRRHYNQNENGRGRSRYNKYHGGGNDPSSSVIVVQASRNENEESAATAENVPTSSTADIKEFDSNDNDMRGKNTQIADGLPVKDINLNLENLSIKE